MIVFLDRNLGKSVPCALQKVRSDVVAYHQIYDDPMVDDTDLTPFAASCDWTFVTRDKRIERRPAEVAAIRSSAAKCIVLSQGAPMTKWDILHRLVCGWEEIESIVDTRVGPFILKVQYGGRLKLVAL